MRLWFTKRQNAEADADKHRVKIHYDPGVAIWIDPEEFLALPDVQRKIRKYREMNMVGKKL